MHGTYIKPLKRVFQRGRGKPRLSLEAITGALCAVSHSSWSGAGAMGKP